MIDFSEELGVDGEAAVELVAGLGRETLREFFLEHDDRATEHGAVRKELEEEGGRNLIGDVGDADVEEGEGDFEDVPLDDLEVFAVLGAFDSLQDLADHPGVVLDGNDFFRTLQQLDGQVTRAGADFHDDVRAVDGGLVHDALHDHGVFQEMLPQRGVGRDERTVRGALPGRGLPLAFLGEFRPGCGVVGWSVG